MIQYKLGSQRRRMFMFLTLYFLWILNHVRCSLLFERTNNISVSSFETRRDKSLQVIVNQIDHIIKIITSLIGYEHH